MKLVLAMCGSVTLSLVGLVGCGSDDDPVDSTPATDEAPDTTAAAATTAAPTTAAPTTAAPSELKIESFSAENPESCDGDQALSAATWSTEGAAGVSFSVDGDAVPADAGQPTSGSGNIAVPCDGGSHEITLDASDSSGNSATASATVQSPSS